MVVQHCQKVFLKTEKSYLTSACFRFRIYWTWHNGTSYLFLKYLERMNQTFNLNFLEAHSYKFCHFRNWPWPIYLSIRTYSYMYVVLSNWLQRKIHNGLLSIERERARQPQHLIWHLLFHESQGQGIPKKITSRLYFNTYIHYIYFFHFFVSPRKNLKSVCQNAMK